MSNDLMKSMDHLENTAELCKGMLCKGMFFNKNVMEWSYQFGGTPLNIKALECLKDRIKCEREMEQLDAKHLDYDELEEKPRSARQKIRKKQAAERRAIRDRMEKIDAKMKQLESELIDHRIAEAKKMGKSDAEVIDLLKTMVTKDGKELKFKEVQAKIEASGGAADAGAVAAKVYRQAGGVPDKTSKTSKQLKAQKKERAAKAMNPAGDDEGDPDLKKKCKKSMDADNELAKSVEDGGFVEMNPWNMAPDLSKGILIEEDIGPAISGPEAEPIMRQAVIDETVHMDPAGNSGQGGLADWFRPIDKPAVIEDAEDPFLAIESRRRDRQ
jgi:hypothetical protein